MTQVFRAAGAAIALLLVAAASTAHAAAWLPPQSTGASATVDPTALAVNPRGDAIAAWIEGSSLRTAFRPAGGSFEGPQTVAGGTPAAPRIALDPQGNAIVIWSDNTNLESSFRPAGGAWQPTQNVSTFSPGFAQVAMDGTGNAIVAYVAGGNVSAHFRPSGGAFGGAQSLENEISAANNLRLAVNAAGQAVAGWTHSAAFTWVAAAIRPAAGAAFSPSQNVTNSSGPSATTPDVAIDQAGNAFVAYNQSDGVNTRIAAAVHPAGGGWSPGPAAAPSFVSAAGLGTAPSPRVRVDDAGNVVAAWITNTAPTRVDASVRPAGGAFGPPETLSAAPGGVSEVAVAAGGGAPMVAWDHNDGAGDRVDTRIWTGAWQPAQSASGTTTGPADLGLGVDDEGNATALWVPATTDAPVSAPFDGAPPTLTGLVTPASGLAGDPLSFGLEAPVDRWSSVAPVSWDFGDGSTGEGLNPTHAYAGAGTFAGRVTVSDGAGNSASREFTIAAQAPPVQPGPEPQPQPLPPPVLGRTSNAEPVSGVVRVRLPGTRRFVLLSEARQIPMGSIVDARKGRVRITATDGRTVYSAEFYEGMFRITQGRRRGSLTNIFLHGGSFRGCARAPKVRIAAKRSKTRSVRHLWGEGTGKFRTVGRFSAATLRGTKWLTDDRCHGTRTRVTKGSVLVRDFVKRRNVLLRARRGSRRTWFARPRARN